MILQSCYSDIILDNGQNIIKIKLQLFILQHPNYITDLANKKNIIYFSIKNVKYNLIITNYVTNSKWIIFSFIPINIDIIIEVNILLHFANGIVSNIDSIFMASNKKTLKRALSNSIVRLSQYDKERLSHNYIECSVDEGRYIKEILKFKVTYVNILTSKEFVYMTNFNTQKILLTSYYYISQTHIRPYLGLFINPKYYNGRDKKTISISYIKTVEIKDESFIKEPSYNYAEHIINKVHNNNYIDCLDIMSCEINDIRGYILDQSKTYTPEYIKLYEDYISYLFYNVAFKKRYDVAKKIILSQTNTLRQCKKIYIPNTIYNESDFKYYLEEQFNSYNHKLIVKYNSEKVLSLIFLELIYKGSLPVISQIEYTNWIHIKLDNCNLGSNNVIYIDYKDDSRLCSIVNKPLTVYMPGSYVLYLCIINLSELNEVVKNIKYYSEHLNYLEHHQYILNTHNLRNPNMFKQGNTLSKDNTVGHITYSRFNDAFKIYTVHYDLLEGNNFKTGDIISINNMSGLIVPSRMRYSTKDILDIYIKNTYKINQLPIKLYTSNGFYIKNDDIRSNINISEHNEPRNFFIYKPLTVDYSYNNSINILGIPNQMNKVSLLHNKKYVTKYKIIKSFFTEYFNLRIDIRSHKRPIINNTVLIENHNYPISCYSSTRFIKSANILPFYKYIETFHILYETFLTGYTGNIFKDKVKKINCNIGYISKTSYELEKVGDDAKVILYTDSVGKIDKIFLLSMGEGYYDNKIRTINFNRCDIKSKIKVNIKDGKVIDIISIVHTGLGYGLKTIPFYNKFIGVNVHNNILDYNNTHQCYYSKGSSLHNNYFNIKNSGKYISELKIYKHGLESNIISLLVSKIESGSINNMTPRVIFKKTQINKPSSEIIFELKTIIEKGERCSVLIQLNTDDLVFESDIEYDIIINIPRKYICFDKYHIVNNEAVPYGYQPFSIFSRIISKYILSDYTHIYYTKRIIKIKISSEQVPTDDSPYRVSIYRNEEDILIGTVNKVIPLGVDKYILLINIDTNITKNQEMDEIYNLLNMDSVQVIYRHYNGLGKGIIIERCVFKDQNNVKFFDSGDFDLCYVEYLKNKTILDYSEYGPYKLKTNHDILFTKQTEMKEHRIKILDSNIIPKIHMQEWDNFHINKVLLDEDYIHLMHIRPGTFFKYNEPEIKIESALLTPDSNSIFTINNILKVSVILDKTNNIYKSMIICKCDNITQSTINVCRETLVIFGEGKNNKEELAYIENIYINNSYDEISMDPQYEMEILIPPSYNFPTMMIVFNNKLLFNVADDISTAYMKVLYPVANTHKEFEASEDGYSIVPVRLKNIYHKNLYKTGDLICLDFGNKRSLIMNHFGKIPYYSYPPGTRQSSMLFRQIVKVEVVSADTQEIIMNVYVDTLPIVYPKDTSILLMKGVSESGTLYNRMTVLPFIHNGEWYTKIPFRNLFTDYNSSFTELNIYNKRVSRKIYPRHSVSHSIRVKNMKGIGIPFMNIRSNNNNQFEYLHENKYLIKPICNGIYSNCANIIGDFQINSDRFHTNSYPSSNDGEIYDWVIIKGLYLGYGGDFQSIYNVDLKVPNIRKFIFNYMESLPNNIYRIHLSSNSENPKSYLEDVDILTFKGHGGNLITNSLPTHSNMSNKDNILLSIDKFNYIENISGSCFSILSTDKKTSQIKFNGGEVNKSVEECMVISELDIELRTTDGNIYNTDSDNSFIFEITERIERIQ